MAKALPFDDAYGNHYDVSYWRLVQLNIGIADRNAHAVFYGYASKAAREAGKQSIGQKSYSISGDAFDQMMANHLKPNGPNAMQLAYKLATDTKDIPDGVTPDSKVSFFDKAQDLL